MINVEFQCSFTPKYVPYSQIVYNHTIDPEESDCCIPDEFSIKNTKPIFTEVNDVEHPNSYTNACKETKIRSTTTSTNHINAENRVPKSPNSKASSCTPSRDDHKKLTFGLLKYNDIKSASSQNNTNRTNVKIKVKKITEVKIHHNEPLSHCKEFDECTFTPKTNNCKLPPYKNFKEFHNFQESFVNKKEAKLKKIKEEILEIETNNWNIQPTKDKTIDKNERRSSLLSENNALIKNKQIQSSDKLSSPPFRKELTIPPEELPPKIQTKPKHHHHHPHNKIESISNKNKLRRKAQQSLVEAELTKQELSNPKHQSSFLTPEKQTKQNSNNVVKKIRSEFLELLQISYEDQSNNNEHIPPILAITILSELFNVELDPNKNEELCLNVINHLVNYKKENGQKDGYVPINKFWDFIRAIISGVDTLENGITSFTKQEIEIIHQEFGYFHFERLLKRLAKNQQEHPPEQKKETSERTNKLAEIYRSKKIEQIAEFLNTSQYEAPKKISREPKPEKEKEKRNSTEKQNKKEEKILKLEDLLILDAIRQKSELEKRKMHKEQQELKQCTFKPIINSDKWLQKLNKKRAPSHTTKIESDSTSPNNNWKNDSIEKAKKIVNKINKIENKFSEPKKKLKENSCKELMTSAEKKIIDNERDEYNSTLANGRISEKYNLAQTIKNVETSAKEKVYSAESVTLLKEIQEEKKQILGEVSNFLEHTHNKHSKEKELKIVYLKTTNQLK